MEATLIYNAQAGDSDVISAEEIQDELRDAGYEPVYHPTERVEDINPILAEASGLVVAAGGDGTSRAAILRLIGRDDVTFTPLPMGTANNICRTLGIEGTAQEIVRNLRSPRSIKLDVGRMQAPWGTEYFIEGAGLGFFAEVLASYDPEEGKSMLRSVQSLLEILNDGFARETTLHLPDKDIHGNFLLVEALNARAIGPHLNFAPKADPSDGLLDVVCIRDSGRNGYLQYLRGLLTEELTDLEDVEAYRVSELGLSWNGFPVHLDAVVHPPGFDFRAEEADDEGRVALRAYPDLPRDATLHFDLLHHAVTVWLPQGEDEQTA